jgi:hypothetical protein
MKKEATPKNAKGLIQKISDEKRGNPKNVKGLIEKTSDEKNGNPKKRKGPRSKDLRWKKGNPKKHKGAHSKDLQWKKRQPQKMQNGSFKRPWIKKEATPKITKGLVQKTSDGQRGNHSKSLVPHQKLANQHNNLKGVSSQSHWIWVPMFNAAEEGAITHDRVGHWRSNFFSKKNTINVIAQRWHSSTAQSLFLESNSWKWWSHFLIQF